VIITCRLNVGTPIKSDVEIFYTDPNTLELNEVENCEDRYENINDFKLPYFEPLNSQEKEIFEKKIVWIFNSGRSGSTWLARDLLNHPSNILWNEPSIAHSFLNSKNITGLENGNPIIEKPREIDFKRPNYFFSDQHKNNWLPFFREMILHRTYSNAQSIRRNVIIKEPSSCEGVDILMECLPKSKLIFLIRDGRDAVDSKIARHLSNSFSIKMGRDLLELDSREKRNRMIAYYSTEWKWSVFNISKAFRNHPPELRFFLKYEDLRSHTVEELRRLYNFLSIKISDTDLKKIVEKYSFENIPQEKKGPEKFYRQAKVGGWKENFTSEEQKTMNSIMEKTLKKFEYQ